MNFAPHVTVATIIERDGKYLLIQERSEGQLVYNQPAGHLEANESLAEAAVRETLEETGWDVNIEGLVGIALYHSPINGITYHRNTFFASPIHHHPDQPLDEGIKAAVWMTYEEMLDNKQSMRSPLVIKAVEQYRDGHRYPLEMIYSE